MERSFKAGLEKEIAKHEWSSLHSFHGSSDDLPDAIRALVYAESIDEAEAAYWRLDNVTILQGRLSQSSAAVASSLTCGLHSASGPGRSYILDLLAQISGGYEDHVDIESVGPISRQICMEGIIAGFDTYCAILNSEGNSSCVDLVLMCGLFDLELRSKAVDTLRRMLHVDDFPEIRDLISVSLVELT